MPKSVAVPMLHLLIDTSSVFIYLACDVDASVSALQSLWQQKHQEG
jgi:hypothetical protein